MLLGGELPVPPAGAVAGAAGERMGVSASALLPLAAARALCCGVGVSGGARPRALALPPGAAGGRLAAEEAGDEQGREDPGAGVSVERVRPRRRRERFLNRRSTPQTRPDTIAAATSQSRSMAK